MDIHMLNWADRNSDRFASHSPVVVTIIVIIMLECSKQRCYITFDKEDTQPPLLQSQKPRQ